MVVDSRVLVLNSDRHPINVLPVLKAVAKVFSGRALFLDTNTHITYDFEDWVLEWEDAIRTAKVAADKVVPLAGWHLLLPEIIVCQKYRGFGYKVHDGRKPKFNRRNLFLRDRGVCQLCGKKFPTSELTLGHIVPRSKGGGTNWLNIVSQCVPCNSKQANRTPSQAGMRLLRRPFVPTNDDLRVSPAQRIMRRINVRPPKTWEAFLGKMYDRELEQKAN